ncbi:MAG: response regulator transcription factor [Limisphaerales bacterium]
MNSTAAKVETKPIRVLVVDDERKIAERIQTALEGEACSVKAEYDGNAALAKMLSSEFDVIVLDIMLPGRDGLSVLKEARAKGVTTPVLAISARGEVDHRIEGLDSGADDYLSKPFALAELQARVRAFLRRRGDQKEILQIADLILDPVERKVRRGSQEIELAAREFKLLEFLMRAHGEVCGRTAILKNVWGYNFDPGTNLVDVYVMRVREKIDADSDLKLLRTIRGIGYVLKEGE